MFARPVVAVAAVVAVVALSVAGCSSDAPSPAASKKSSAAESTPKPVADDVISGGWETFDRVLLSDDVMQAFNATGVLRPGVADVPVYVPGDGLHTISLTADTGAGEVKQRMVNVGGADRSLMLIVATMTRIPAHGLDKDEAHNQLDSYNLATGRHIATYEFPDSQDENLVVKMVAATRGDFVAVDFLSSSLGKSITGLNMRTGKKVWDDQTIPALKTRSMVGTSYGTFATTSDTSGKPADRSSCYRADGFDTATGKMLWSVDAATILDKGSSLGYCADVRTEVLDQKNANRANYDTVGAYFEVVLGMSSPTGNGDEQRNFDGITGTEVTNENLTGDLDLLGGYSARQPFVTSYGPLVVKDISTGKTVYTLDQEKRDELDLQIQGMFGGYLYTKTTDGSPIIDVATGDVVADNTTNMPRQTVGDYTLYEDGTISLNSHLGATKAG